MFNEIYETNSLLKEKFNEEWIPLAIFSRLLDRSCRIASQINNHEKKEVKGGKLEVQYKNKLAKEIHGVIQNCLQISMFYKVEEELKESISDTLKKLKGGLGMGSKIFLILSSVTSSFLKLSSRVFIL